MCLIGLSLLFIVYPTVKRTIRHDASSEERLGLPEVIITCREEHIAIIVLSMLYESTLIGITTVLGAFSFKYPENFNEAKYISFCTFALLTVWIGLIPTYFATQSRQEYQNAAVSFFVILSACAVLIFIFGPQLFIMIFQPKRNSPHVSTQHTEGGTDNFESRVQTSYKTGELVSADICFSIKTHVIFILCGRSPCIEDA